MADVLFGVETQHFPNPKPKTLNACLLHLKAFSPLRKKKSTLSLSLYEEREKKAFFSSSRVVVTEKAILRSLREQRERIGIGNYPRAETSP